MMNKTLDKIQRNLGDIQACVWRLEADPIAKIWMQSIFPHHKALSETVENTRQLVEGFIRELEKKEKTQ